MSAEPWRVGHRGPHRARRTEWGHSSPAVAFFFAYRYGMSFGHAVASPFGFPIRWRRFSS